MQPPATTVQLQELFSTASQNLTHPLLPTLQPSCPPKNVSFFQKGKNIPIHHIFQKCIPTCTLSPNLTQNTQNADDRGGETGTQKLCLQIPVTLQIPPMHRAQDLFNSTDSERALSFLDFPTVLFNVETEVCMPSRLKKRFLNSSLFLSWPIMQI